VRAVDLETALKNRLAACALIAMLAPYGISLPYVLSAHGAERTAGADTPALDVAVSVHTGGTAVLNPATIRFALADTSEQGKRPFYKP
jgi:hypothetical protein